MMQATLEVRPSQEQMQQLTAEVKKEIEESLKLEYIAVDLEILLKILPYSRAFLEENILSHPKVKVCERRKGIRGKRIWLYEPVKKAILDIINNWEY